MSEAGLFRTIADVMTSPRLGDFTVEHWSKLEPERGALSPIWRGMAVIWLEKPSEIQKFDFGAIVSVVSAEHGGRPVEAMRVTEYVGPGVAGAYNGWKARGWWTAEEGMKWL